MGLVELWDRFSLWIMHIGMPVVQCYHLFCGSVFLNVAAEDAKGIEKIANDALIPVQYLFAGKKVTRIEGVSLYDPKTESYTIEQRFDYNEHLLSRTLGSIAALPISLPVGCILKGISYLSPETRARHQAICYSINSQHVRLNNDYYKSIGIEIGDMDLAEFVEPPKHKRRPEDGNNLTSEIRALKDIVAILKEKQIPYWVDCGTCLGAQRYGGIIPWDCDIDIAVLQPDFENIKHALNALDPQKYAVQDWSSRDKPNTYLKVYIKETGVLVDIYHFAIDPEKKEVRYILSNEDCVFMIDSWKIRERRFTVPTPFSHVFPLKKANFDGIEVMVPNKIVPYLQARYGENIEPAKVYDEKTGKYEKDLTHPYWKIPYVH
jgi:hypothetical protein